MNDQQIFDNLLTRKFGVRASIQLPQIAQMRRIDWTGKTVLELGAWDGRHSEIAMMLGAENALAIDRFQGNWEGPTDHHPRISFREADVEFLELDSQFDVVIACGILYHLHDPIRFVDAISTIARSHIMIWTHVATSWRYTFDGFRGDCLPDTDAPQAPFSTFWFRLDELLRYFVEDGWHVNLVSFTPSWDPIGPAYTLLLDREAPTKWRNDWLTFSSQRPGTDCPKA